MSCQDKVARHARRRVRHRTQLRRRARTAAPDSDDYPSEQLEDELHLTIQKSLFEGRNAKGKYLPEWMIQTQGPGAGIFIGQGDSKEIVASVFGPVNFDVVLHLSTDELTLESHRGDVYASYFDAIRGIAEVGRDLLRIHNEAVDSWNSFPDPDYDDYDAAEDAYAETFQRGLERL